MLPALPLPVGFFYGIALTSPGILSCGLWHLWRARRLGDVPLSRIRSAAQGQLQLLGRARLLPGPPIVSPISRTPCVWWRYRITVHNRDDRGTVEEGTSEDLFQLEDTTGRCIVDPVGARVEATQVRRWRGPSRIPLRIPASRREAALSRGRFRFSEEIIPLETLLLVHGWFRTQSAVYGAEETQEVGALLAEWKRDRRGLLRRFDANRDGNIDAQEWELARAAALEEIRQQHTERIADPDLSVLCSSPDHREFLISAIPREALIARDRRRGFWMLLAAAGAAAVSLVALHHG